MRRLPSRLRGASSLLFGTTVAVMTTVAVVGLGPGLALAEEAPATTGPETTEGTEGARRG